jgi:hypothetical protein
MLCFPALIAQPLSMGTITCLIPASTKNPLKLETPGIIDQIKKSKKDKPSATPPASPAPEALEEEKTNDKKSNQDIIMRVLTKVFLWQLTVVSTAMTHTFFNNRKNPCLYPN